MKCKKTNYNPAVDYG